jgi:group I intron endonuclease
MQEIMLMNEGSVKTNSGIYKIVNKIDNKYYVGRTAFLDKRWGQHVWSLKSNRHPNRYLQFAWNKYGESAFEFIVIEYLENENSLEAAEQCYLDQFIEDKRNGINHCYNLSESSIGPGPINKGKKRSQETRNLMSASQKGRTAWNKGRKMKLDHEYKSKSRKRKYGRIPSDRKLTTEQRSQISKEFLNRPEVKAKFTAPRKPPITARNILTKEIKTLTSKEWESLFGVRYPRLLKGLASNGWKIEKSLDFADLKASFSPKTR